VPAVEYVLGLECDLTAVEDVAAQELVFAFAEHLHADNEHNRPLEHLVELLGASAAHVTAAAAIDGEYGKYLATLVNGQLGRLEISTRDARARYSKLRKAGIKVVCPQADVAGDPLFDGRLRHKLAAIASATRDDLPRLLRALAQPKNDATVREQIYSKLTMFRGDAADDALVGALIGDEDAAIKSVIPRFVRRASLLARLPDVLARAWSDRDQRTVARVLELVTDMNLQPDWLAAAPADLRAEIERRLPPPALAASDVDIDSGIDAALFAAATTGDPFDRLMAVKKAAEKRKPNHVPTFIAALAHGGDPGTGTNAKKYLVDVRRQLYSAMSFHEAQLVRDALLAGLRDEPDEIASGIIYVAWRQENLLARLPEYVFAAWNAGDSRYLDRLREIWRTHAGQIAKPKEWPDELRKRVQ
jgi:hypothetical protein